MQTRFNRMSTAISLLAGILTILQVIWAGRQMLTAGLVASVPAWLLVATAFSAFLLGWFLKRNKSNIGISPENRRLRRIGQIDFEYLPDPPNSNGWQMGIENEAKQAPTFSSATDGPITGCLKIESKGQYYADYDVDPSGRLCDVVALAIKVKTHARIYLRIKVASRNGQKSQHVWLAQSIGNRHPKRFNANEWEVFVSGEALDNGWTRLEISIPEQVEKTFGNEGWVYKELLGFRLRGSLSISPLTLLQSGR